MKIKISENSWNNYFLITKINYHHLQFENNKKILRNKHPNKEKYMNTMKSLKLNKIII